jgi:protocadherin Fat 4
VKVGIVDKNDTPPLWEGHPSAFTVSEDLSPGQVIATVRAFDADTIGHITYSFVKGNEVFSLDPSRGIITLLRTLDRETLDEYHLTIRAKDGVQSSDLDLLIKVMDTNDNAPSFDEPCYSLEIDEDELRGATVGSVRATDNDQGPNGLVTYSVISDWANDVFSLNPTTGVFTLASRLDYEQVRFFQIFL